MKQTGALAALLMLLCGSAAGGMESPPEAADILFERPQWSATQVEAMLTYSYARTSNLDAMFGPTIADRIRLGIKRGGAPENRTVRVEMFSQDRRRPAGPFEDVPGNPALVLFLEHHVETLARVLKANPRYLKNAIRAGLRDRAAVMPTTVEVGGRSFSGWRIETEPFIEDPNRGKMRGLETLQYSFVDDEEVPVTIVSVESKAAEGGGVVLSEYRT